MKNVVSKGVRVLALLGCSVFPAHAVDNSYKILQTISVPGDGGWDYLTIDSEARRLFISHATQVQIMDVDLGKIVGTIPETNGVHGIALSPNFGFVSDGKDDSVTIFDRRTLATIRKVSAGHNPDAIVYEPMSRRVLVFNGKSQDMTVLDAATGDSLGRLPLGGKPEFAVVDTSGTVYDNLEDQSMILAIDPKAVSIKHAWSVAPGQEPSSLAIDPVTHRLFIGCGNQKMVVVNSETGAVVATLPIGNHVDATVFDASTGMIFTSNGEGTITVIHEDSADHYHVDSTVKTAPGARTVALDASTHHLFLATADLGPAPPATTDQPHPRPKILPGTFKILVVGN